MDTKKRTATAIAAGLIALLAVIGGASIATGQSDTTVPEGAESTTPAQQAEPDRDGDGRDCPEKDGGQGPGGGRGAGDGGRGFGYGGDGSGDGSSPPATPSTPSTPTPTTPSTPAPER